MLIQTNSYVVPDDKRTEHERLMRQVRQCMARLGCERFEVHEEVDAGGNPLKGGSRFVQIMRFRDRVHHQAVQEAERHDPAAQELIREFSELIDLDTQRDSGTFTISYFTIALPAGGADAE